MSVKIDLICWSSHTTNCALHFTSIFFFMNLYTYTHIQSRTWCSLTVEFFFSNLLQEFIWAWLLRWSILACLNRSSSRWVLRSWWVFDSDGYCFQWNDFNSCEIFMTTSMFSLMIESLASIQHHDYWIFSNCANLSAAKAVFQDSKLALWESSSCLLGIQ